MKTRNWDSEQRGYLPVKVKSGRRTLEILVEPSDHTKCSCACPAWHMGKDSGSGWCQLPEFGPFDEVIDYRRTERCKEVEEAAKMRPVRPEVRRFGR